MRCQQATVGGLPPRAEIGRFRIWQCIHFLIPALVREPIPTQRVEIMNFASSARSTLNNMTSALGEIASGNQVET
jgi:hypothetical protein